MFIRCSNFIFLYLRYSRRQRQPKRFICHVRKCRSFLPVKMTSLERSETEIASIVYQGVMGV